MKSSTVYARDLMQQARALQVEASGLFKIVDTKLAQGHSLHNIPEQTLWEKLNARACQLLRIATQEMSNVAEYPELYR